MFVFPFPTVPHHSSESANTVFLAYFTALERAASFMQPFKGMAKTQAETVKFMSRRAQAMMEIPAQLATCHNRHDILSEQMRYWDTAAKDYAETSQRLMEAWAAVLPSHPSTAIPGEADSTRAPVHIHDYIEFPASKRARRPADRSETYAYGFA